MADHSKGTLSFQKKDLFDIWRTKKTSQEKNSAVLSFVLEKVATVPRSSNEDAIYHLEQIKSKILSFTSKLNSKWTIHNRTLERFLKAEAEWLEDRLIINIKDDSKPCDSLCSKYGRPTKDFSELSISAKRRKISPLVKCLSLDELTFATSVSLNLSGQRDASKVLLQLQDPTKIKSLKSLVNQRFSPQKCPEKYTPEEALALFVDSRLTKASYTLIQTEAKKRNANLYPTYKKIMESKESCYPEKDQMVISETSAELRLQALLDHTTRRILATLEKDSFQQEAHGISSGLTLTCKWGCDGSSGHSMYKQRFSSSEDTDSFVFVVCIVPLQMKVNSNGHVIWSNPSPSSTRFCRPLKLAFKKESPELTKEEVDIVEHQIAELRPTNVSTFFEGAFVFYDMNLTMIDGKTYSALVDSSNQSCGICGATPKIMNKLDHVKLRKTDLTTFRYGLSTLHAYIRFLECILHLSYRLDVQKWQVKDASDKIKVEEKKKYVQEKLKTELGLLVDVPKPNYGTTNDGNTGRRFFDHHEKVSVITGVNPELVKRFAVILKTMSSGKKVDIEAFQMYLDDTAKLYVQLYPWYYMPSSIHRVLVHGTEVVQSAVLPIGMLSEEALESRNKDIRRFRQFNTRKISRNACVTDLFHALLFSSDPVISTISSKRTTKRHTHMKSSLDEEVSALLSNTEKDMELEEDENEMEMEVD